MAKYFYVRSAGPGSYDIVERGGGVVDTHDTRYGAERKAGRYSREKAKKMATPKRNAGPKVKGRKVKGGRAVTLKNFTGSVIRKANGQVVIEGKGRK